jgi:peptidyl-prolyl cis-trans isomerase C
MNNPLYGNTLKQTLNALMLVCLAVPASLLAQTMPDPVVIQLPDRQVLLGEFNNRFEIAVRMLANRQGIEYGGIGQEQKDKLRVQYLRQRASELVMLQQADQLGVETDQQQLDAAVAEFFHIGGEGKDRQQVLQQGGFNDETQLRHYLTEQERIRLTTAKIVSQIVVPPGDVMTMHHDLADQLVRPEQICMRQIAVADEQTARQLLEKLKAGADFDAMAREHSTDKKTGENGGDMGCFEREGRLARSEFEGAAFNAKEGEITGPVKSEFGYHLILVYDRIAAHTPTLNEAYKDLEDEIRHEKLPDILADIIDASGVQTFPDRLGTAESSGN